MPAVEVEELRVRYGDRTAVDGVSFSIDPGEVVALLGPNGAGKTSTVETIEGYRSPFSGKVRVLGLDPQADRAALAPHIGVVLQDGGAYPVMSPARVLSLFASYYDEPRDPAELLTILGLDDVARTSYKRLSGGERQRLLLALALLPRPSALFLDEPTAGVDPAGRIAVREVIGAARDGGAAVLLTSHELDEVERLADRIVIIDHGVVVAAGSRGEVGGGVSVRFAVDGDLDVAELTAALGVAVIEDRPGAYRLDGEASPVLVARITAWCADRDLTVSDLSTGSERLEDVFLRVIGRPR